MQLKGRISRQTKQAVLFRIDPHNNDGISGEEWFPLNQCQVLERAAGYLDVIIVSERIAIEKGYMVHAETPRTVIVRKRYRCSGCGEVFSHKPKKGKINGRFSNMLCASCAQ